MSPGVNVQISQIADALMAEVLKREVLEGDKADAARKVVRKSVSHTTKSSFPTGDVKDEAESDQVPSQPEACQ
jgi:hypothetical protein